MLTLSMYYLYVVWKAIYKTHSSRGAFTLTIICRDTFCNNGILINLNLSFISHFFSSPLYHRCISTYEVYYSTARGGPFARINANYVIFNSFVFTGMGFAGNRTITDRYMLISKLLCLYDLIGDNIE